MNPQDHKQALPPGFRLGSYHVVRVLGAGGFGVTYLCEHGGLGVTVAVKEYLPNDIAVRSGNAVAPKSAADREGYQWGLSRFLDEARTLARFEHRNVVRVRDYFEANGTAYIVMDYEDGEPLDRVLERTGTLTEAQIKRLLLPIVAGLRQMHTAGFLHRDVKPANIFIRRSDESPVLLDFGSARQALGRLSRSVTAIASSGYSPPEQYESNGEQGPWTDIYALSALCYRAVTGKAPVEATRRQSRLLRGEEDPLPKLAEIARGRYSQAFLAAVNRGLRVVEGERQGSLDEWWAELEGGAGEAANAPTTVRSAREEGHGLPAFAQSEGARSRRRFGLIVLLLVGLLVQVAALWELLDYIGRSSRRSGGVDRDVMTGLLALPGVAAIAIALLRRRPKREVIALLLIGLVVQVVALWELVTALSSRRFGGVPDVVYGLLVLPGATAVAVALLGWQRAVDWLRWRAWVGGCCSWRKEYGIIALLFVGSAVQVVVFLALYATRRSLRYGVDPDVVYGLLALPGVAVVAVVLLGWPRVADWLRWRAWGRPLLRRQMKYGVIAPLLVGLVVQVVVLWELVPILGRWRRFDGMVYALLALPGAAAVAVALLGWQHAAGWLRWRALGWRSLRPRMKYGSALTGWFRRRRRRKWCKAAEQGDAPTGEDP